MVLPIVIWIMRDQFLAIPIELEQAARIDGASVWAAFILIVVPIALPGMVAALILSVILCWNEYFFAALLTSTDATTLPVMVASQTGSQGINWWSMAALSTAAIAPLIIGGVFLERYIVKGADGRSGEVEEIRGGRRRAMLRDGPAGLSPPAFPWRSARRDPKPAPLSMRLTACYWPSFDVLIYLCIVTAPISVIARSAATKQPSE